MSNAADMTTIPNMLQHRALGLANGMGLPATHQHGDDFSYIAVADVAWDDQFQDMGRWTVSLDTKGRWHVSDGGRWDYLEVHAASTITDYDSLIAALSAVRESRQEALAFPEF